MNWKPRSALLAAVIGLALTAVACGSSPSSSSNTPKGTITVAGFKFSEGSVLAELYGQALQHDGYTVNFKLNLGSREVVAPAIKSSQVDLYIGYAATDLEYYDSAAGEATGDVTATTAKLNSHLQSLGLQALTPSAAQDQNGFAMTQANATKYNWLRSAASSCSARGRNVPRAPSARRGCRRPMASPSRVSRRLTPTAR